MFTTIKQFIDEWKNEALATERVLSALTDESLGQQIAPKLRTLGELGWHLVTSLAPMLNMTGLKVEGPSFDAQMPASAAEIVQAYRSTSQAVQEAIQQQWTDENLLQTSNMFGDVWANGVTLSALIKHQIHHRGQMTVLIRQAGLVPPDIYGPTLEQMEQFSSK
ncbi:DinB family protein [Paenibacillus solisilvae]|uniref:DinB family protein n=1 Tax=Paenibacillus solisilvae TaxID=2486751 RepID=A0ABW0VU59_9BACL